MFVESKIIFSKNGIGLVEAVIGTAVFLLIAVGVYQSYSKIIEVVRLSRLRATASTIANEKIELIRNLSFQDVGIAGGFPAGKIPATETITRNGAQFNITTTIRNIDDPFDGIVGGSPNDTAPADYKLVQVEITCLNCRIFQPFIQTTTVSPKDLEIAGGGGALFIKVIDANGNPVPQAKVHVENKKLTPNLVIDDLTNNLGLLQLVDVPPSTGGYNSSSTKAGYSTDQTYPPGGSNNPNPIKEDSTVAAGEVTQITLAIDRVSAINVSTTNQICSVLPNISFQVDGSKLIGSNKLKYSTTTATDASGQKIFNDLEWDVYKFIITDAGYDLAGSRPFLPVNLAPNTTQDLQLLLEVKNPRSLLVGVKDSSTGLPVSGATVKLEKAGFLAQYFTGQGFFTQTDWSGGAGQASFIDPTRYFDSDGNIDIGPPAGELKLRKIGSNYQTSGWLESSTFDTGSVSDFHNITWQPTNQPVETGPNPVKFQVASNNDNATWNFGGPDGTAATYYTLANTNLGNHNGKRYLRYRAFLSTADDKKTPNVSDISFTFTSACVSAGQAFFNALSSGIYTMTVTHPNYQTFIDDDVSISSNYQQREVILSP